MKPVAVCFALLALALPAFGAAQRPLIVTTQDHSLVTVDDCAHFYARTLTSFPAQAQSEEQLPVTLAGFDTVHVRGSEGGAVSIKGWDRPVARLTVCKYAVALSAVDAKKTLRDVHVTTHNGEIAPVGPKKDGQRTWWVHMILRVPKRFGVDVASTSGGIAIRNIDGRINARATNGGISVASCTGESTLSTENGGISLEKILGPMSASAQNGSISLRLDDGDTTPIEARTDDANEILCRAKVCQSAMSSRSGGGKVLRIGQAQPMIRLFSGGAPILIEQVR